MATIQLLVADGEGDTEHAATLASRLRGELVELDLDDVSRSRVTPPDGAKGDGVACAELIVVTFGSLGTMIELVLSWTQRNRGTKVTVSVDGDSIAIEGASGAEQRKVIQSWIDRNKADADEG